MENKKSEVARKVATEVLKQAVNAVIIGVFVVGAAVVIGTVIFVVGEKIHPTSLEEKIKLTEEYISEGQASLAELQAQ